MRRAAAGALVALGLAGCGSPPSYNPLVWVGISSVPANKPTELAPIKATVTPQVAWRASVGKGQDFTFYPALEGSRVYAAAADGTLSVVEMDSGRVVEHVQTKERISGGLTAGEGRVFAGTIKGQVLALEKDGKVAWRSSVAGEVIAPVAVSRKTVVARTSDGRIFGLSVDDGKRRWVFQRAAPTLLLRSEAGVLAIGGDVVAGYPNGKLIALDLDDGKLTWEVSVSLPHGATELERIADVAGLPVVEGSTICAAAFQGKVACFDIASRNQLWARDLSSALDLASDAKNLYAVDDTGAVHALAKSSGSELWKQDKLRFRRLTSPEVSGAYVLVGDGFGYLHVLSTDNGEIVGRIQIDSSAVRSIVPTPGGVLVQTSGGTLALVRL